MGHIFFIMGISGSGKGTLIKNLKNSNIKNIHIPLSYKTRPIRKDEIDGEDAYFISKEDFFYQVQSGEFLEYAKVHDIDFYGTKYKDVIDNGINLGKIVIKELDIIGLKKLIEEKPELDLKYTTIFLNIPCELLKQRIEKRGAFMSDEEFEKRLISTKTETIASNEICDYIIDACQDEKTVFLKVLEIINKKVI